MQFIHKDYPTENYLAVRNDMTNDCRLSAEALGVLTYLLSKPEDWQPSISEMGKRFHCGRDRVRRIIAELEGLGYVKKWKRRTGVGQFSQVTWKVYGTASIALVEKKGRDEWDQADDDQAGADLPDQPATENPSPVDNAQDAVTGDAVTGKAATGNTHPKKERVKKRKKEIQKKEGQPPAEPAARKKGGGPKFDERDLACAQWMYRLILGINPKHKAPNFEDWANTIRLMRERDNRTYDEIASVFTWANNDDFWYKNILCAAKLRKQFDMLTIDMNGEKHGTRKQTGTYGQGKLAGSLRATAENDF